MFSDLLFIAVLTLFSLFDVFNNRELPDLLVYSTLFIALLTFLHHPSPYFATFDAPILLLMMLMSISGFIGSGDVYVALALSLIKPFINVGQAHIPTPLFLFLGGGLVFASLFSLWLVKQLLDKKIKIEKPLYLLIILPFMVIILHYPLPLWLKVSSFAIALASTIYLSAKHSILSLLAKEKSVDELEDEDFLATELMTNWSLGRVVDKTLIKKMKEKGIKKVKVYVHLPPFLPFMLLAYVISLFLYPFA
jgi:hypothetical protein